MPAIDTGEGWVVSEDRRCITDVSMDGPDLRGQRPAVGSKREGARDARHRCAWTGMAGLVGRDLRDDFRVAFEVAAKAG